MAKPQFTESGWFYSIGESCIGPFAQYMDCATARRATIRAMQAEGEDTAAVSYSEYISEAELAYQLVD